MDKRQSQNTQLMGHLMSHIRPSPRIKSFNFKCTVCKMSFARSSTLKVHQKTHEKASVNKPPRSRNDKIRTPEFIDIDKTDDDNDDDDQSQNDDRNKKPNIRKRQSKPKPLSSTRVKLKRAKIDVGREDEESTTIANNYNKMEDNEFDSITITQLNNYKNIEEEELNVHLHSDHNHKIKSGESPRKPIQKKQQKNDKLKNCEKSEDKVKRLTCSYCNWTFRNPGHLVTHIRIHTKEKPFKCQICQRYFTRKDTLMIHQKTHNKTNNCSYCNKVFKTSEKLNKHIGKCHSDKKPYKCSICSQRYTFSNNRDRHERVVHHGRRYDCGHCDKSFARNDSLGIHTRKHHALQSEDPAAPVFRKTSKISKPFNKRNDINSRSADINITVAQTFDGDSQDADENQYKCPYCDESFRKRKRLKKHIDRTHLGEENPFECVEEISPGFSCPICSEIFLDETSLAEHSQEHYEVNYICEFCEESFTKRKRLQKHIKNFHLDAKSPQTTQKSKGTSSPARPTPTKKAKSQLKPNENTSKSKNLFFCPMCPKKFSKHEALIKHSSNHRDFFLTL